VTIRDYQADRRKAVQAAIDTFVSQGLEVPDHLYKLNGQSKPKATKAPKPKAATVENKVENPPLEHAVPEAPKAPEALKLSDDKPSAASS
jgi:hypothetical protein